MSILIYFATIFWSLFPNLIHVFQGGEDYINKVNETNLVGNGDLSIDSDSNGVPDGFTLSGATANSLVDGIFTFTAIQLDGQFRFNYPAFSPTDIYYNYVSVKSDSNQVHLGSLTNQVVFHSGSSDYEFLSSIGNVEYEIRLVRIIDLRNSGFTPISINYMGAYNISTMITHGIKNDNGVLFSDLNNEEIRLQLDQWITEHGSLDFTITKDNTADRWFNTGFVEKTAERDFLDYLGYFFWLMTPPIILFATLDLIRRVI